MLRRTHIAAIRTVQPPRPAHTVIAYLDHYGNPIRSRQETDLSLIRTRDNKFYLQRVFEDESVVRFPAPGMAMIKNANNMEYFTLTDIDIYGGVLVPFEICPSMPSERPSFQDACLIIMRVAPTEKFTRRSRRAWHRRLHADWRDNPETNYINHVLKYMTIGMVVVFLGSKYLNTVWRNIPLYDEDQLTHRHEDNYWMRAGRFVQRHPEHLTVTVSNLNYSPALAEFNFNRAQVRQSESLDPSLQGEFVWKLTHLQRYGHWPAGCLEEPKNPVNRLPIKHEKPLEA